MKSFILSIRLIVLVIIILFNSCKKEDKIKIPIVETISITNITESSAISGGNITDDGGAAVISRGVCWSTGLTPTISSNKTTDGEGVGNFSSNITGLNEATTYYVVAYATNSSGTGYGSEKSFTTLGQTPTATTQPATNVTTIGATLNGTVNANYLSTIVTFEYGVSTSYGQTANASQSPVTGSANTSVSANIAGLLVGTTYHFRVKTENDLGAVYGSDLSFTTSVPAIIFNPNLTYGSVSDNDGNTYKTIPIGTQTWMAENLKTTKYNDGATIPLVTDGTAWAALSTPAYCWYNNDAATFKEAYGALYNWYTVNTGKLCPTGWHVPTYAEWNTLTSYLGGESVAGGKLKETGTSHWSSPNTGATNESGFTALPGGSRTETLGSFVVIGSYGNWWSSTVLSLNYIFSWYMYHNYNYIVLANHLETHGYSIRCVKN